VALVLTAGWFSVWGLYATYTWTVGQTLGAVIPIHVVRFYVPALGLIALLAAWFFKQLPRWVTSAALVVLAGAGVWSYQLPANHVIVKSHLSPFLLTEPGTSNAHGDGTRQQSHGEVSTKSGPRKK
jgi:hypothetical protein